MTKMLSLGLGIILALAVAACGGDETSSGGSNSPVTIASASNCDQVMDAFIPLMQELLNSMSDLTLTDLASEETPESLVAFEERMEEIGSRAEELNCSDEELKGLLVDRVDELSATGPVAEFLLEILKSGEFEP
jgi:hypothetical protein